MVYAQTLQCTYNVWKRRLWEEGERTYMCIRMCVARCTTEGRGGGTPLLSVNIFPIVIVIIEVKTDNSCTGTWTQRRRLSDLSIFSTMFFSLSRINYGKGSVCFATSHRYACTESGFVSSFFESKINGTKPNL